MTLPDIPGLALRVSLIWQQADQCTLLYLQAKHNTDSSNMAQGAQSQHVHKREACRSVALRLCLPRLTLPAACLLSVAEEQIFSAIHKCW